MDPQDTTAVQTDGVTPAEITPAPVAAVEATSPAEATAAATTPAETSAATAAIAAGELEKVRELVIKANPEVVPDLVRGRSIDELLASVEPAKSAYQRVADAVRAGSSTAANAEAVAPAAAVPPAVPAGGASNVVDPSSLASTTKIALGLAEQRKP